MRIRVHTASGSVYALDSTAMTWERINARPIVGYDTDRGTLSVWPAVVLGQRMELRVCDPSEADEVPITTATVVRGELL